MFLRIAKILLLLLVFSLCYTQPFVSIFSFQVPPTEFIFLGTAAFWFLALIFGQTVFRFHKFYWLLLYYFAAMLISAIFSDEPRTSFIKLAGEIYLLSLPILIFNLIENFEELKRIIWIWLIGTIFVLIFGFYIFALFYLNPDHWLLDYTVGSFGAVPVGNFPRLRLNFLSPSMLCNYLSVSFSLLLIAFKSNWIDKIEFYILAILLLFAATFTVSSGLGGFALITGFWIFYINRKNYKIFARLSLISGITAAFLFWILNFVALQPHTTAPYSFKFFNFVLYPSPRLLIWQESLRTFMSSVFVGRGVGRDSCEVLFQNTDGSFATLTDAHNIFLSVASQEGIFGLSAIILLIIYLVKENLPALFANEKLSVIQSGFLIAFVSAFIYQGLVG